MPSETNNMCARLNIGTAADDQADLLCVCHVLSAGGEVRRAATMHQCSDCDSCKHPLPFDLSSLMYANSWWSTTCDKSLCRRNLELLSSRPIQKCCSLSPCWKWEKEVHPSFPCPILPPHPSLSTPLLYAVCFLLSFSFHSIHVHLCLFPSYFFPSLSSQMER